MAMVKSVIKRVSGSSFARSLAAYCASEAGAKISRLLVVIAMARNLDAATIGIIAIVLATGELFKALTENGIGQRLIASQSNQLESKCVTAHRLFWIWCVGLFVAQTFFAFGLYLWGGHTQAALLIALLGVEYLFMPAGLVSCALAMREGKLTATAAVSATQNIGANISAGVLLFFWASPLAVVLPKLMMAPVWLIGMRRIRPWQKPADIPAAPVKPFIRFGSAIVGVEMIKALRMQADKLIVGAILGAEALGVYYFAINAGLGITTSFITAFSTVVFPFICSSTDKALALIKSVAVAIALVTPIVVLQFFLAEFYVALVFGAQWAPVAPLVSILCMAAIPAIVWSTTGQWLRANNMAGKEFVSSVIISAAVLSTVAATASFGLETLAWSFVSAAIVSQFACAAGPLMAAFRAVKPVSFFEFKPAKQGV